MVSALRYQSRGVALITTLLVVALIAIIVISFFAAVTVALRSSS